MTFNASYDEVAQVPTMIQAGYAIGVAFLSPFGDTTRQRQLTLTLILISASLSMGLALTTSFLIFRMLSFLLGVSTISPQIILMLARDHAPPARRATSYALVLSGSLLGTLAARILGGTISRYANWRYVFVFACATQYVIFILLYLALPDTPPKNARLSYGAALRAMSVCALTEPAIVQCELVSMALGAAAASWSVTSTFLLGGPPYYYSTLKIGLFGLTELAGVILGPCAGYLLDHAAPWTMLLVSSFGLALFQVVDVAAGGVHLYAVIIRCIGVDAIRQLQLIALSSFVYTVSVESASRLNALLVLSFYLGQLAGTLGGSKIFVEHGPRAAACLGLTCYASQTLILLVRRPRTEKSMHT